MGKLTHLDEAGNAHMVDVSEKVDTLLVAEASGFVRLAKETVELLRDQKLPKGDALAAARIAGIMGAKNTSELIPLCHPLQISKVAVDLAIVPDGVAVTA